MQPTPEDFAHSRLIAYAAYQWPSYRAAAHHRLIARHLEAVERGEITRLIISMPPRHGKSMLASEFFPAWYLGRNPSQYIIAATYAQELADDFGRKVRDQIAEPTFQAIFPGCRLKGDSTSSKRFHVTQERSDALATDLDGAYFAAGIGGPLTGRGAHLLLIDDPVKNREEAESETIRRRNKDWYTSTAYTRLMPGAKVVIIQCMVGDTRVLMADGSEKPLRDICPGDHVATYKKGKLATSRVRNWANQGPDCVLAIRMKSGIIVKANKRHPFLVDVDGKREWVRLRDLKIGDRVLRAIGGNGAANHASMRNARSPQNAVDTACLTTTRPDGQAGIDQHPPTRSLGERRICDTDTASTLASTMQCSPNRMVDAPFAGCLPARIFAPIGGVNFASTTIMQQARSEDYCATTATWRSDTEKPKPSCSKPLSTYEIAPDVIIGIEAAGEEDVFDIQIDETENFIANGLISHNTRWHDDDLTGWQLREHQHEGWVVLSLPAIAETDDDIIGRKIGQPLWDNYPLDALNRIKLSLGSRDWSALYQQRPAPAEGGIFKAEWFRRYAKPLETYSEIVQSWDTAFKPAQLNDPSVCTTWGVKPDGFDLLHVLVARMEYPDLKAKAKSQATDWNPTAILIEDKASGQSLIQDLRRETQLPVVAIQVKPNGGDKTTRASGVSAMVEAGRIFLPQRAAWLTEYEMEMLTFPNASHDDQVDSTSQFLQWARLRASPDRPMIRRL